MYLTKFDIIMLQETWATDTIELDGFTAHQLYATASNKKGRSKGGLLILISTKHWVTLKKGPTYHQFAIAVVVTHAQCYL